MKTIQEILAPDRSPSEIISDLKMKTIDWTCKLFLDTRLSYIDW